MGLYVGNTRVSPVIMATPIYRGSYNIVTDLGLTTDSSQSDIITALESEISTPQYANYCFVDIPYANYSEVSGYDEFTTTDDYVGYYVLVSDVYTLVTADNKDSLNITAGTTVAYSVSYTSYFEKIQRYRYNGNSWEYEYDVDFSGYATVNADNFTDAGTTFLSGLGMPDWTHYDIVSVLASGSKYTAPANGWFFAFGRTSALSGANINMFYSDNSVFNARTISWTYTISFVGVYLPVKTGDEIQINYSASITFTTSGDGIVFIYAEGNPTPPQP